MNGALRKRKKHQSGNYLGKSNSGEVLLIHEQKKAHMHITGASGTGKSKFLELMLRQALKDTQAGFALLDPHGSLVTSLLEYAAKHCLGLPRFYRHLVDSLNRFSNWFGLMKSKYPCLLFEL